MSDFPALAHVAITVRDLQVSAPWYEALFDSGPAIDEDTDPDMHHTVFVVGNGTLVGLHQHRVRSTDRGSITSPLGAPHARTWRSGRSGSTSWASPTARSRTPTTAPA
jgi:glyoxylase I family protein